MIATSQFTISVVNDGQDGVGIVSTIIEYAVSSSGTIPPGNALIKLRTHTRDFSHE